MTQAIKTALVLTALTLFATGCGGGGGGGGGGTPPTTDSSCVLGTGTLGTCTLG